MAGTRGLFSDYSIAGLPLAGPSRGQTCCKRQRATQGSEDDEDAAGRDTRSPRLEEVKEAPRTGILGKSPPASLSR